MVRETQQLLPFRVNMAMRVRTTWIEAYSGVRRKHTIDLGEAMRFVSCRHDAIRVVIFAVYMAG